MTQTVPTREDFRYQENVTLTVINCGECGGTYAINERRRLECSRDGTGWHCPYCKCGWGYYGDSSPKAKLEKVERELENQKKRTEWAQQEAKLNENRRRAEKAAKTRIKNRIAKGVCPCCNRTFQDLQRHMATKHPDFTLRDERNEAE